MAQESASAPVPQQIIDSTERLLARGGLLNASLNSIAAGSAVHRGSLLHYFPEGKNQIVKGALQAHDETFSGRMMATLVPGEGFAQSLSELMQGTAKRMKADGFSSGCPVAGVVLDLADSDWELRSVCADIVKEWEAVMADALTQLDKAQRQATGEFIMAAYEGAVLMAKLKKSTGPLLNAARHIAFTLRALT
jgi:TetR/AcrR family transcriptional repressor of lmrAB and yxaGH operons